MGKRQLKKLLEEKAWVYEFLAEEYKADKELTKIAVNNGDVFAFVPEELETDKEVIIAALEYDDTLLEELEDEFLENKEILFAAVDVFYQNYEYFAEELQKDKQVALECLKISCDVYDCLCEELQQDEEIIEAAIRNGLSVKQFEGHALLEREELVRIAIEKNDGNELLFAPEAVKDNEALVSYALQHGLCSVHGLSRRLAGEKEYVRQVIANIPKEHAREFSFSICYMAPELKKDAEFLLELIALQAEVFRALTIIKKPVKDLPEDSEFAFPLDVDFVKRAYAANKAIIRYVGKTMKEEVRDNG